jgi:GH15 family glucan-1,4-alpha-glucosidase
MPLPIEQYALIGDSRTAALVGLDGSIDWLCLPQIDSRACFAALLGSEENGRWLLAPDQEVQATRRRYHGDTLVLETEFTTATGRVRVVDFMPRPSDSFCREVVRIVEGVEGYVQMRCELALRFCYGRATPWVRRQKDGIVAVAGAETVHLRTPVALHGEDMRTLASFTVLAGCSIPFVLCWTRSFAEQPPRVDATDLLQSTVDHWQGWSRQLSGEWLHREAVMRSLLTLKALTHRPSGGIAAAATTSLPERLGGVRNWDYRFCWIRDATFTLYSLLQSGFRGEARDWVAWLVRAAAGSPEQLQIMYTVEGYRLDGELTLDWLPGYEGSRPVRIGNAAHGQLQLDVPGELFDVLHAARKFGIEVPIEAWSIQRTLLAHLEQAWTMPDRGVWEVRGDPQHFTHSKMMAWVAVDRAIKAVEDYGLPGPVDRWRALRRRIHEAVCAQGFNARRGAFTQTLEGQTLDASLLMMPLVGFLPPDDPRVVGTVEAIRRELASDGLVLRYRTEETDDGLPATGEGAFLATSFWLADCLAMQGRYDEASGLFDHLLSLRNDVGLLAEEYDPRLKRQLGNFPQAFSHVGVVNTAHNLTRRGPAQERRR